MGVKVGGLPVLTAGYQYASNAKQTWKSQDLAGRQLFGSVPRRSLANDLMTFYAPDRMYTEGMTVMEMICCSPCITSMICFSLEVKFQSDAEGKPRKENLFDSAVGFHDGRLAARGNATSFMLPWQGILQELRQLSK